MNSIHASVGIIVAIVANTWIGRIAPPFIWGAIWCLRLLLLPGRPQMEQPDRAVAFGAEYLKATVESLAFSVTLGALKAVFRYAVLG